MALQIYECFESGTGTIGREASDEYSAIVTGDVAADNADDPGVASLFAVQHFSALSQLGNVITNISRERVGPGVWKFTGRYRNPIEARQTNDASFSFTMSGGTQHITQSRRTVASYGGVGLSSNPDGSPAVPDHKGSIGVTEDGSVEGVDIHVATYDFKTTFYTPTLTTSYMQLLKRLRSRVNSDTVAMDIDGVLQTFQPGELLFLGADGSKRRGFGDWEFTLSWSSQDNIVGAMIPGVIQPVTKRGWDYIWFEYWPTSDTSNLTRRVKAAYVEQVYDYQPLKPLLLPTAFGLSNAQPWLAPQLTSGAGGPA